MNKLSYFEQIIRRGELFPHTKPFYSFLKCGKDVFRWVRTSSLAVFSMAAITACVPPHQPPQVVETTPPKVSYNYTSDDGLIEANAKARTYCSQYASTPSLEGSISQNQDGTKTVTFECVKTATVTPAPPPPAPSPPRGYTYRSDTELLQAMQSADAYCSRSGQIASSRIITNPDGTKTMTYQCVAR